MADSLAVTDAGAPTPITPPPGFAVTWPEADDARLFWTHDRMHFPDPVSPLLDGLMGPFEIGFNAGLATYEMPVRSRVLLINSYFYQAIYPLPLSPEEMEEHGKRSQEKLSATLGRLGEYWHTEQLPQIKEQLAYFEAFDLRGASMPQLLAYLDEAERRHTKVWEIHFQIAFPMLIGLSMFDDLYHDLFGADETFGSFALLQGLPNMTLQTNSALWDLSRQALRAPEVRSLLEERAAAEVVPALEGSAAGRTFLAELRAYLQEYGQRGDKWMIDSPSWYEDPTPVIKSLKDYIAQFGDDPAVEMAARAAERERRIADARTRLAGYPQEVVGRFEFFLKAAQEANVLSEDHGFWIDCRCMHQYRRVLMEFGRRFTEAGALRQAGDVFLLTPAEMRETAVAVPPADRKALVQERQAEMARARAVHPPPALGTPPPGPPPDSPMQRAINKFWGAPPQPETERGVLYGNAGSPGTARGPVRVVRTLDEAGLLQFGDILVAETTAPPWTPLFATAAAVVTDTGGILSHCAVVAREYRIPAVVGTGTATTTFHDGQIVEVDGAAGTVRLVSHD